jgi:hypothetical protein
MTEHAVIQQVKARKNSYRILWTAVVLLMAALVWGCDSVEKGHTDAAYDVAGFGNDKILMGTIRYPGSEDPSTWAKRCVEAYKMVMDKAKSSEYSGSLESVVIMVAEETDRYPKGLKIGQFKIFLKPGAKDKPAHIDRLSSISNPYAMLLEAATSNCSPKILRALTQEAKQ